MLDVDAESEHYGRGLSLAGAILRIVMSPSISRTVSFSIRPESEYASIMNINAFSKASLVLSPTPSSLSN